jgi:hypothetical protein
MAIQYSTTHRTNGIGTLTADVGASGVCKIFTGAPPATCATADTGTLLTTFTGNATFGSATTGVYTLNAITGVTASGSGTAGYFRWYPSAATTTNAVIQGTVFQSSTIVTSATTAANSNVLTFAAVSGISVGQTVSGTGILTGTTVIATTGTTVTLSLASTAGVGSGVTITFGGDMNLTNTSIVSGQTVNFTSQTITAYGA